MATPLCNTANISRTNCKISVRVLIFLHQQMQQVTAASLSVYCRRVISNVFLNPLLPLSVWHVRTSVQGWGAATSATSAPSGCMWWRDWAPRAISSTGSVFAVTSVTAPSVWVGTASTPIKVRLICCFQVDRVENRIYCSVDVIYYHCTTVIDISWILSVFGRVLVMMEYN